MIDTNFVYQYPPFEGRAKKQTIKKEVSVSKISINPLIVDNYEWIWSLHIVKQKSKNSSR